MKEKFQVMSKMMESLPDTLLLLNSSGCVEGYHSGNIDIFMGEDPVKRPIEELGHPWLVAAFEKAKFEASDCSASVCTMHTLKTGGRQFDFEVFAAARGEEVVLIIRDVTELTRKQRELQELFDNSCEATVLINEFGEVAGCNNKFLDLLQYSAKEEVIGSPFAKLSSKIQPDGKESEDEISRIMEIVRKKGNYQFEWWLQKLCGTLLPVEIVMAKQNIGGRKIFCVSCRDIINRKKIEYKLEYLGYHDQLTGLYNRRFYEEELKRLDVPRNYPLTIIVGDVNGLKLINDSFGHAKGDEVIKKMARSIVRGCRREDIVARLGGDEYVILLPETSSEEAEIVVKRIKAIAINEKVDSLAVSASFGWATKNDDTETTHDIFKRAEDFMYREKLFESSRIKASTISAIIKALNEKNEKEELHSIRVSNLCAEFGRKLGLPEEQIEQLSTLGRLHDIGKISVDDEILKKESMLDLEELEQVRRHPETGFRILSSLNDMAEIAEYVLAHHEQWDGKGYPKGLKGEEIPLQSRLLFILEAYDAMTSDKSYKQPLSVSEAVSELEKNSGIQFDPRLVEIFIKKVLTDNYNNDKV